MLAERVEWLRILVKCFGCHGKRTKYARWCYLHNVSSHPYEDVGE
jgi:hypothetical protein